MSGVPLHPVRPARRRALTVVELIIGCAIMGVTMLALASFTTAVAAGWRHSRDTDKTNDVGQRVGENVRITINNMLAVVYSKPGSQTNTSDAYLFYWANDGYDGVADDQAQGGEMGLVEYRASTRSLYLWEPKAKAAMTAPQQSTAALTDWAAATNQADADSIVNYYKSSGIATARQIAGPDSFGTGMTVDAVSLNLFTPTGSRPMVMYELVLTDQAAYAAGDSSARQRAYGTATLRAARKPTNLN